MNRAEEFSLQEAIAELRRQQESLVDAREKLRGTGCKVASRDNAITVSMKSNGEIAAITFNTTKFRRMAPAELGAALTETINQASAEIRQQVVGAFGDYMPSSVDLEGVLTGKSDFSAMFDDAVRKATEIMRTAPTRESDRSNEK